MKKSLTRMLGGALALGAMLACHGGGQGGGGEGGAAKVKLATAAEHPVEESASFIAELNSRRSIALNPQVSGYLKAIFVKAGDQVKAGQPLFQIDAARDQALLNNLHAAAAAQASAVKLAEANQHRAERLAPNGVVSQQELEQATSALESAKAQLAASESQVHAQEVQVGYFRIVAPYDGTLADIPSKVGDFVTPQTQLTVLNQNTALEVYVRVPLAVAPKLGPDTRIQLLDDDGKVITEGTVAFISPTVDTATQSILVKTLLPDAKGLKSSQFVHVKVIWSKKPALTVPEVAVSRLSGQYFVYVAKAGQKADQLVAEQRPVQLGEIVGNDYIVHGGLKPGDRVVVAGTQKVRDGAPLQPD